MSFNFVIPRTLQLDDHTKPATITQDLYSGMKMPGSEVPGLRLAGKYDGFFDELTPQGIGGVFVRAYNFTDKPIVMVDANNNATMLEPVLRMGQEHVTGETIVVDIFYLNQDQRISRQSEEYLKNRRKAWINTDMTDPVVDGLNGNFVAKANLNRMYRYYIPASDEVFERYDDAFFFEPGTIVLGTIKDINKVLVHPKSDDAHLKKGRPKLESVRSLGAEIGVNDPDHVHDKVFTTVFGSVVEVPITRDPTKPSGITYWENVHQNNSQPVQHQLGDPNLPVKLYANRLAAETGGAPDKQIELDLVKEKLALAQSKIISDKEDYQRSLEQSKAAADAAAAKIEHDRNEREKAREQEALLRERDLKRKAHEDRNREHVENVSFWRKVLLEGAKTIGAIAATATLLFGWYAKKKAS